MTRSMSAALFFVVGAMISHSVRAQTPEKFAPQIKAYTQAAEFEKEILAQMLNVTQDISEFTKDDVKLITAYMDQAAAAWTNAAAALQKGDQRLLRLSDKQARDLDHNRDIWNQRLSWRRGQAQREYLPASEQTFNVLVGDRKPAEIKEIEAFIEAKKLRSEAFGRLADAALPGADQEMLARLQDEVYALDVEVQVADMKRVWAEQDRMYRLYVATDPTISSAAFSAAKARLSDWRKKYEETYRQSRAAEHALEQHKRQGDKVFEARSAAYKAAKAARDGAAGKGK